MLGGQLVRIASPAPCKSLDCTSTPSSTPTLILSYYLWITNYELPLIPMNVLFLFTDLSIAGSTNFHVDFDKIVKNVRELNVLGGEGEKKVQHTVKGAKLTTKESIPLTIYANGIFMFNGPFRSFENQETQVRV